MSMNYCGVKKATAVAFTGFKTNPMNANGEPYESLGDKILSALDYGTDSGTPAIVQYDDADTDEVDVLTDPNHDFFDIAETYQTEVAPTPAPQQTNGDE